MEVILSVAFGLQTNFQVEGDETITKEAMKFFTARRSRMIIGKLLILVYQFKADYFFKRRLCFHAIYILHFYIFHKTLSPDLGEFPLRGI